MLGNIMKNFYVNLLALLCLSFATNNAFAMIISYEFTGNITSIEQSVADELGLSVDPSANQLNATLHIDTLAEDIFIGDTLGSYNADISFSLGDLHSSTQSGAYTVFTNFESVRIGASGYTDSIGFFQASDFGITLEDINSPDLTLTDDIPLEPFNVNNFNQRSWLVFGSFNGVDTEIHGNLVSMQRLGEVPNPASIFLFLLGGLVLVTFKYNLYSNKTPKSTTVL